MHDLNQTAFNNRPGVHVATDGEFAGWLAWQRGSFESPTGPFWHRMQDDGSIRSAFRVEKKHLNGGGNVHGGCFKTIADYCLFAFAAPILQGPAVTVSFSSEFLDAAREGELVEATGEVTRAGMSLVFVRGMLRSGARPLLSFSATIKRLKRRAPEAAISP